jgi:hypothetical protein
MKSVFSPWVLGMRSPLIGLWARSCECAKRFTTPRHNFEQNIIKQKSWNLGAWMIYRANSRICRAKWRATPSRMVGEAPDIVAPPFAVN